MQLKWISGRHIALLYICFFLDLTSRLKELGRKGGLKFNLSTPALFWHCSEGAGGVHLLRICSSTAALIC